MRSSLLPHPAKDSAGPNSYTHNCQQNTSPLHQPHSSVAKKTEQIPLTLQPQKKLTDSKSSFQLLRASQSKKDNYLGFPSGIVSVLCISCVDWVPSCMSRTGYLAPTARSAFAAMKIMTAA